MARTVSRTSSQRNGFDLSIWCCWNLCVLQSLQLMSLELELQEDIVKQQE